ncbi:MAG: lytic transglycosylase domain-containing protein [Clostridia bacterium]
MNKKFKRIVAVIVSLAILSGVSVFGLSSLLKTLYPLDYAELVEFYANENNLEVSFVFAVINCESSYNPNAISSADARGLMQITPDTFEWLQTKTGEDLELDDLYDPEINIKYGCLFYGILMDEFGIIETSIAGYHAGMNIVSQWLEDEQYSLDSINLDEIPYPSTADYVEKVMFTQIVYQKLYGI